MTWDPIISFTDKNTPYRFKISTTLAPGSDQCRVDVVQLNGADEEIDRYHFMYDVRLDMPEADYALHDKPITLIISQMLSVNNDPSKW